jgi:hypothetical protein
VVSPTRGAETQPLSTATTLSLAAGSPIPDAQQWIDRNLDDIEAGSADLRHVFTDLQALAAFILRRARPRDFLDFGDHVEHAYEQRQPGLYDIPWFLLSAIVARAFAFAPGASSLSDATSGFPKRSHRF